MKHTIWLAPIVGLLLLTACTKKQEQPEQITPAETETVPMSAAPADVAIVPETENENAVEEVPKDVAGENKTDEVDVVESVDGESK